MKTSHIYAALTVAIVAGANIPVNGQNTHPMRKNEKIEHTMFEGDTTIIKKVFQEASPASYRVSGLPRFAIFGKEGKFYLGIGGTVKTTVGYDFGNPIPNPNSFTTSAIPMQRTPGNGSQFDITAQQSGIFFNVVALPGNPNQISAYISFNFTGNNYAPSLSHAYLNYRGIRTGYASTLFTDEASIVPTIDNEGPNAATSMSSVVLDYGRNFGKKKEWRAAVGVEMPQVSFTEGTKTQIVKQRVPDIPAYIQYSWNNGSGRLRLSGVLRNMMYRDLKTSENVDKVGWGVQLSGYTPIVGNLSAYYQAVYGEGISNYIQDLNDLGMDMMPVADNVSELKPVKAWGGFLGLQYQFSSRVFATCTYSHVRTYAESYINSAVPNGTTPYGSQYKYAQYVVGNVFWNITSYLQTGIEYLYGRRVNYDGAQAHDNRIQTMLQFNF